MVPDEARCQAFVTVRWYRDRRERCPFSAKVFGDGMRLCMVHFKRMNRYGWRAILEGEPMQELYAGEYYP